MLDRLTKLFAVLACAAVVLDLIAPLPGGLGAIVFYLSGLVAAVYWCWSAEAWTQEDWGGALILAILLGPFLFPLGTLVWGDHGVTYTQLLRRNRNE